ncbi:MAG TPA: DUF4350 domain-containing protein [Waterburya sp.]|jgi:hypothetical protein
MNFSKRRLWIFGAIAITAIILITLLAAPANNKLNSGSTYNRSPEGYGAWYAFMSERGTPVKRWRKPFEDLAKSKDIKSPITLLRVNSRLSFADSFKILFKDEQDWIKKGNTLVILGVHQPVTKASFSTLHKMPMGDVKIDTQRRNNQIKQTQEQLLGDRFGAIVWQENLEKGQIIFATTPYLAANAYQDFRGNYEFLARIVTQSGIRSQESEASKIPNVVWVDEYIHGYKDAEVIKREHRQNILSYFTQTPVFPALVQIIIFLLVAIWAGNRRFGKPKTLPTPAINNSEAYIQALAGVLQKANSSEFILDVVGKEEQLQLQKALFLGQEKLDHQTLINAWLQQTGHPATELEQLLQMQTQKHRMSEPNLLNWLRKWQLIRQTLTSFTNSR